jgi:hypothetical protein
MGNLLFRPATQLVGLALIAQASFSTMLAKPAVVFTSPCTCEGNHGVSRWAAKTDPSEPPSNNVDIKPITPAQIYSWQGPGGGVTHRSGRLLSENGWYALTGRVSLVRIEDDGDLHIVIANADGRPGGVVVELPLGPRWCEMRKTVFSWTNARFPVSPGKEDKFTLTLHPIVTVVGKAFYDIDHSGADTRNNRRNYDPSLAVWEIHPVMGLAVGNSAPSTSVPAPAPMPSISSPTPTNAAPASPPISQPTATPEQFVTITKPVTIQVPYGTTVLQPGMKLPVLSRDSQSVDVRYLNARYSIPISSTDLR